MRKITIQEKPSGIVTDPYECPFREFKDSELSPEYWGMGAASFRGMPQKDKTAKGLHEGFWIDEDIQPLPRSVRFYLDGWVRAETIASDRFEAEVAICNENDGGRIIASNFVISYLQILQRSSFCRNVLCSCFVLENMDTVVEHQWDGFSFSFGTEGWRPKFHIYCPGMKPGGGQQHRPILSKNGCYLVRLYYLGCWRCIWVDDRVPVDASGAPLLPFSPLLPSVRPSASVKGKQPVVPTAKVILLWPLLICKALLKLWVPDMNAPAGEEDESMEGFNIIHALTGSLSVDYYIERSELWDLFKREVQEFVWDNDNSQTAYSVNKSKPGKKLTTRESPITRRTSMTLILMADTKNEAIYRVPGVTPNHEMNLMLTVIRDIPLQKPMPEPEVPHWKTYRWVDWARSHGLYEQYECPREKYLKCLGLLKLSYSPHMLDVTSAESIFAVKTVEMKKNKETFDLPPGHTTYDENKYWVQFDEIAPFIKSVNITFFPSMLNLVSVGSSPPVHINKVVTNKFSDIQAPKYAPVYLQIDAPGPIRMQIGFNVCHPRVMVNAGHSLPDYIPPGHLVIEEFGWFDDVHLPIPLVYLETSGYDNVEVKMGPGRHTMRLWVSSQLNWHFLMTSHANLQMGSRDVILAAAVKECAWSTNFLLKVSTAFNNWIRSNKSTGQLNVASRDFYSSYLPDLPWVDEVVGYPRPWLHWMLKQALQTVLYKRLASSEYRAVCRVLKKLFYDPNFGNMDIVNHSSFGHNTIEFENLNECDESGDELERKRDRYNQIRAATIIQTAWRRHAVSKCFSTISIPNEVQKTIMDVAFGNLDSLSSLWNEFFMMYPGAKSAFSVASALTGGHSFLQYSGVTKVTSKCKWVPFFQCVFFCHNPVNVNLDLKSTLPRYTFSIYNNDTMKKVNSEFYTRLTQEMYPNFQGYTVLAHASLEKRSGLAFDSQWQFSILCSSQDDFHICDSPNINYCREMPLQLSSKLHIDEIFIPNKRNILGTFHLAVTKFDCVSFRAETTMPQLEIVATLLTTNENGEVQILDTCKGYGLVHWPFIALTGPYLQRKYNSSSGNISYLRNRSLRSIKSNTKSPKGGSARAVRSHTKMDKTKNDVKFYTIEVTAPRGWPLTVKQWMRVEDHKNSVDVKTDVSQKKMRDKPASAKDRQLSPQPHVVDIRPGDPFTQLEVAVTVGGSITAKRDDSREVAFAEARKSWDAKDPGRNMRGAQIRKDFRELYLNQPSEYSLETSKYSFEVTNETQTREYAEFNMKSAPNPTPNTESVKSDKELFITMPEEMRDKFVPLDFLNECTVEETENKTLLTSEMIEAAAIERDECMKMSKKRMLDLQEFNKIFILEQQKRRSYLLENLFVDATLSPSLTEAFRHRAFVLECIAHEKAKKK